jgi:streptogramin lyase
MKGSIGEETHQRGGIVACLFAFAILVSAAVLIAGAARASGAAVPNLTESFELPSGPSKATQVASTAGGELWVLYNDRKPHHVTESATARIGRLVPGEGVREFPMPPAIGVPKEIATGGDGELWFATGVGIGRIDSDGHAAYVAMLDDAGGLAAGPGETVWFTDLSGNPPEGKPFRGVIGLASVAGVSAEYPVSEFSSLGATAPGSDGGLWFARTRSDVIGHISAGGQISETALGGRQEPLDVTEGPEGNAWFAARDSVDRLSFDGQVEEFQLPPKSEVKSLTTSEGRIWFSMWNSAAYVGTITPAGVMDPERLMLGLVNDLTPGPGDSVLFATGGEGICNGGGGGCELAAEENTAHGTIGRILSAPLFIRIEGPVTTQGSRARVKLRCGGGNGASICTGQLRLIARIKRRGVRGSPRRVVTLGYAAFSLQADEARFVSIKLPRGTRRVLTRRRNLPAEVIASPLGAASAKRRVTLPGSGR